MFVIISYIVGAFILVLVVLTVACVLDEKKNRSRLGKMNCANQEERDERDQALYGG